MLNSGNGVVWNKPSALVCWICGREYGTSSLKIHVPQCAAMWKKREALKPKQERRPVPKAPQGIDPFQLHSNDPASMQAFNEQSYQQYKDKTLIECENCGRKFAEER